MLIACSPLTEPSALVHRDAFAFDLGSGDLLDFGISPSDGCVEPHQQLDTTEDINTLSWDDLLGGLDEYLPLL